MSQRHAGAMTWVPVVACGGCHRYMPRQRPGLPPFSVDNFVENPLRNGLQAMPGGVCDAV